MPKQFPGKSLEQRSVGLERESIKFQLLNCSGISKINCSEVERTNHQLEILGQVASLFANS